MFLWNIARTVKQTRFRFMSMVTFSCTVTNCSNNTFVFYIIRRKEEQLLVGSNKKSVVIVDRVLPVEI